MDEAAVRKKLHQLNESVRTSPLLGLGGAEGLYEPEAASDEPALTELLGRLGLQLKYILFDLEATRRENRYLRQMLDARNGRDQGRELNENW